MRNLLGGIISAIIGSMLIVTILQIPPFDYPEPFGAIWIVLIGCKFLANSLSNIVSMNMLVPILITWMAAGIISGFFSESKWNSIRTAVWLGVCIATISVMEINLMDPEFWDSDARNLMLLAQYIGVIIFSMISLVSSIPVTVAITRLRKEADAPIPTEIVTTCECGEVFKSRPLICSECGKSLVSD